MNIEIVTKRDSGYVEVVSRAAAFYFSSLGIQVVVAPDAVCVAIIDGRQVGFCGLFIGGDDKKLTTEWYIDPQKLTASLPRGVRLGRSGLCEIGMLVTEPSRNVLIKNRTKITSALIASILLYAFDQKLHYVILTGSWFTRVHARRLKIELQEFGPPELSTRSESYRKQWQPYFDDIPRICYGFEINGALHGCRKILEKFQTSGFLSTN